MYLICLDLEGVLTPEIWIAFSEMTGIPEFRKTTRDEPDYDKLMRFRIELLGKNGLTLRDIKKVVEGIEPLPGAVQFTRDLRELTELVILSDTYEEFAKPLMAKLNYPALFCNSLITDSGGAITGYRLRQKEGKKMAVRAFKSMNVQVFAAGDSFNDLGMIREADGGCLFRAPEAIRRQFGGIPCVDTYDDMLLQVKRFLAPATHGQLSV
jgi:phosphoserine/homoserine phosphotransferase